jgi:hypothetical protein
MKYPLDNHTSSCNAVKDYVIAGWEAAQAAPQVKPGATQSGPVRQKQKPTSYQINHTVGGRFTTAFADDLVPNIIEICASL